MGKVSATVEAIHRKIKQVGIATALQIAGLELLGDHHRALADAINIARQLPWALDRGRSVVCVPNPKGEGRRLCCVSPMRGKMQGIISQWFANSLNADKPLNTLNIYVHVSSFALS